MKIAKQFLRFGVWFLRGHLQFSYERHSRIENFFWKRIFRLDRGVDDKNSKGTISRQTFHDSYYNTNSCEISSSLDNRYSWQLFTVAGSYLFIGEYNTHYIENKPRGASPRDYA
jgi:hypothetical protein